MIFDHQNHNHLREAGAARCCDGCNHTFSESFWRQRIATTVSKCPYSPAAVATSASLEVLRAKLSRPHATTIFQHIRGRKLNSATQRTKLSVTPLCLCKNMRARAPQQHRPRLNEHKFSFCVRIKTTHESLSSLIQTSKSPSCFRPRLLRAPSSHRCADVCSF